MNHYEEKIAARKARLEARAARLDAEAHATLSQARQMADAIPFGQPILVGHHSEKRDRNYRAKIGRKFDKSLDLYKAAERTAQRADSVGSGGISSDDPDAVVKLKTKLANLEHHGAEMVALNKAWKKAGNPAADDSTGWQKIADLVGRSPNDFNAFRQELARRFALMPYRGWRPFESYEISNNGAEIRRVKQRIATLEARAAAVEQAEATGEAAESVIHGIRVIENLADNRLQLFFPGKPDAPVRAELKSYGFRWAPSVGAWQRQLSNGARYAAECVLKTIGGE